MKELISNLEVWKVAIPSIVTIIGFIITYNLNIVNIKEEIYKSKNIKSSENLEKNFQPLLDIVRFDREKMKDNKTLESLNKIFDEILIYGSSKLIRIATAFKEYIFIHKDSIDVNYTFAYIGLIISQLKFDISGEYIPADTWYRYTITDYGILKLQIVGKIEEIIKELHLNKEMSCKS